MNHIEKIFLDAGIRVLAEWQDSGQWLITDVVYSLPGAKACIEAPFLIPSLQTEKWLELVFSGDIDGAQALEVDHGTD